MQNSRQFRPVAQAKAAMPNTTAELHQAVLAAQHRRLRDLSDRTLQLRLQVRYPRTHSIRFAACRALRWIADRVS